MQHTLAGPAPPPATALILQGGEPRGERPRRERSDVGRGPRPDRMERGERRDGRGPREPREPRERGERAPRRGRGERGDRRGPPPQDSGGTRLAPQYLCPPNAQCIPDDTAEPVQPLAPPVGQLTHSCGTQPTPRDAGLWTGAESCWSSWRAGPMCLPVSHRI